MLSYSPVNVPATPTEQQRRVYTRSKGPVKGGRGNVEVMSGVHPLRPFSRFSPDGRTPECTGSVPHSLASFTSPLAPMPNTATAMRTWPSRTAPSAKSAGSRQMQPPATPLRGGSAPRPPAAPAPHRTVRKCEVSQVQVGYTLPEFDRSRRHRRCLARWGSEAVRPGRSGTPRRRFGDRRSPGRRPSRHDLPSRRLVIFPSIPSSSRRHHDQLLEGLSMIRIRTL